MAQQTLARACQSVPQDKGALRENDCNMLSQGCTNAKRPREPATIATTCGALQSPTSRRRYSPFREPHTPGVSPEPRTPLHKKVEATASTSPVWSTESQRHTSSNLSDVTPHLRAKQEALAAALASAAADSAVVSSSSDEAPALRPHSGDRFVPSRRDTDMEIFSAPAGHQAAYSPFHNVPLAGHAEYANLLQGTLLSEKEHSVLGFKPPVALKQPSSSHYSRSATVSFQMHGNCEQRDTYRANTACHGSALRCKRLISHTPEKILDAPNLLDDYYLNLLDWGSSDILAVALGHTVYLWNSSTTKISQLCRVSEPGDYISSVKLSADGRKLAVGTNSSQVRLYDVPTLKLERVMEGHLQRVGSLAWSPTTGSVLASGSRDALVFTHDVRAPTHYQSVLACHRQEVCGLAWSGDGKQLASGGNDNLLCIWDAARAGSSASRAALGSSFLANSSPRYQLKSHCAAVKALAWHPRRPQLLASGGGTADGRICFWNSATGTLKNSVETRSQVCALVWNTDGDELVSSHGFSQNQLTLWNYPTMSKMAELTGHTSRVLHLARSPDGETVVSGAPDETLRFWKVFGGSSKHAQPPAPRRKGVAGGGGGKGSAGLQDFSAMTIR